jgi:hypothetical protein
MLIDALNFSNNALVGLLEVFIDSCRLVIGTVVVAHNTAMVWNEDMKQLDTTNFL